MKTLLILVVLLILISVIHQTFHVTERTSLMVIAVGAIAVLARPRVRS